MALNTFYLANYCSLLASSLTRDWADRFGHSNSTTFFSSTYSSRFELIYSITISKSNNSSSLFLSKDYSFFETTDNCSHSETKNSWIKLNWSSLMISLELAFGYCQITLIYGFLIFNKINIVELTTLIETDSQSNILEE